jgi:DNA processing protein
MSADADLRAWLRLTSIPGIGRQSQQQLLKAFGLPEAVFSASAAALRSVLGTAHAEQVATHDGTAAVEAGVAWAETPGNHILTIADHGYPQLLLSTQDPPLLLYVKGRVDLLNGEALAIVGSRNATKQGEANAETFAEALSHAGVTVCSGLALGIDAAAHRGALKGRGSTIAVIGTGADRIYPARNDALAREIAERGVIVSEFPLGMPPLAANFPRRNRIIAGLCQGCLVVEAAHESGSLITARLAADAGREVFAIPGSIHSPVSRGCHGLIKQGAKLVESAQDILDELPPRDEQALPQCESGGEPGVDAVSLDQDAASLLTILAGDPCSIDLLVERTGLTPDSLLAMLLPLELEGRVAQLPGGRYQRLS